MVNLMSKTKQKILGLLFANEDREFYIREIARLIGASPMGVQKELAKLEKAGIVVSEKKGIQKFYSVNKKNPTYAEIKGLAIKSFGVAWILKDLLSEIAGIREAFIYGSFAKGEADEKSDIDLFVVGDTDYNVLSKAARKAEDILSREVNFDLISEKEFKEKQKEDNPFIKDITANKRIELIKNGQKI